MWATLRDLKDAKVDPEAARQALLEGHFREEETEKLETLIALYRSFLKKKEELGIMDRSDLAAVATEMVPFSNFLKGLSHIFYYGFYDLTQVQLDLFHEVVKGYPATLFFPLQTRHPDFGFAKKFYERYVHGKVNSLKEAEADKKGIPQKVIISASGIEDEILIVAKKILSLVDKGYKFSDIGVVGRTLEGYRHAIKRVFEAHKIPFISSLSDPVIEFPLAKIILLLITLQREDYHCEKVFEILSSPYLKFEEICEEGGGPRHTTWEVITKRLSITKGIEEWRRLERFIEEGFKLSNTEEEKEYIISVQEVSALWCLIRELHHDFSHLPPKDTWGSYVRRFKELILKYVKVEEGDERIKEAVFERLESLSQFDIFMSRVSLDDFISSFERTIERQMLSLGKDNLSGVKILDAMAARGIPVKVLFIVGLNEGVFPRHIHEDAFLRDGARRVLETVLGYKISQKLAGYEEERLLFRLFCDASQDRLYCLYQRSDESGRTLVPSLYLKELGNEELTLPRHLSDKFRFFDEDLLTPKELILKFILEERDPIPLLKGFNLADDLFTRGLEALTILEISKDTLTAFDGLIGPIEDYLRTMYKTRVSPTSLEIYAQCPFQYFARYLLDLPVLERKEIGEISPSDIGSLYHRILKGIYEALRDRGYFDGAKKEGIVEAILIEVSEREFERFEEERSISYPLLWRILQDQILETVKLIVEDDLLQLRGSGFIPLYFEEGTYKILGKGFCEPLSDLQIYGCLDRIDFSPSPPRYRVIDYKFKTGSFQKVEDKNLLQSAIRGQRLQPPLYLLIAEEYLKRYLPEKTKGLKPEGFSFYFIAPNWKKEGPFKKGILGGEFWNLPIKRQFTETLGFLIEGIVQGFFFILPNKEYCSYCDYSSICRRNHLPSRWRVEQDKHATHHLKIRREKPGK